MMNISYTVEIHSEIIQFILVQGYFCRCNKYSKFGISVICQRTFYRGFSVNEVLAKLKDDAKFYEKCDEILMIPGEDPDDFLSDNEGTFNEKKNKWIQEHFCIIETEFEDFHVE